MLLCINHPNNLIDSLLVGAVLPWKVHYLATAALFRNFLIARFLVALGWQTIIVLPLVAYGAAVNFFPYYLPGWQVPRGPCPAVYASVGV